MRLKGPKQEIFESGFFTEIRPVRIGDLGPGEKKLNFVSWSLYFKVFAANILLSLCSQENIKIAKNNKLCEMP
jgi:hypothetical protein